MENNRAIGPLNKVGFVGTIFLLGKSLFRWISSWRSRLVGMALREYYETAGLSRHETSIIHIPPGEERFSIAGRVWVGAFSMIWVGDDPSGQEGAGKIVFGSNIYIGDHCNLRAAGGTLKIGDNVLIGNGVTMVTSNHGMKPGEPMIDQIWETFPLGIEVGSDVWIGAHAVLLPGCKIGKGSVVAAGAVVRGEVEENTIVGGVPAKTLRKRPG